MLAVLVHPPGYVTVTEYTPACATVIDCVVAPVFHILLTALELVSVTESPLHNTVGPLAEMVGVGGVGYTLMVNGAETAEQGGKFISVTVTV
jgi:hypothetical protein